MGLHFSKKLTIIISQAKFPWHREEKKESVTATCSVQNFILLHLTKLHFYGKEIYLGIDKGNSSSWLVYGRSGSTTEI